MKGYFLAGGDMVWWPVSVAWVVLASCGIPLLRGCQRIADPRIRVCRLLPWCSAPWLGSALSSSLELEFAKPGVDGSLGGNTQLVPWHPGLLRPFPQGPFACLRGSQCGGKDGDALVAGRRKLQACFCPCERRKQKTPC